MDDIALQDRERRENSKPVSLRICAERHRPLRGPSCLRVRVAIARARSRAFAQQAPWKRDASVVTFGPVAQWIRHRPTELGIAGSSPAGVISKA